VETIKCKEVLRKKRRRYEKVLNGNHASDNGVVGFPYKFTIAWHAKIKTFSTLFI